MAVSKTAWKKQREHDITLPSGAEIRVALPDLSAMIKSGNIPNDLLDVATKIGTGEKIDLGDDGDKKRELLGQALDFNAFIVEQTVIEPKVTAEEVRTQQIPAEDVDLIVQIALRKTDFDAVGKHLGGLETVESFRKFRGLDTSIEDLLGAQGG